MKRKLSLDNPTRPPMAVLSSADRPARVRAWLRLNRPSSVKVLVISEASKPPPRPGPSLTGLTPRANSIRSTRTDGA